MIANEIGRALRFMQAIGIDLGDERSIHEVDIWTSHEALLLDYEEPLVRQRLDDGATGTPARRTSSGSASGRASSTARTSSSSPVSTTRSGSKVGPTATPDDAGRRSASGSTRIACRGG